MKKEMSLNEYNESVSKGYLHEHFPTKEYLHEHFPTKAYLHEHFPTKEYLHEHFVTKEYLDIKLKEQSRDFRQHLDSIMEHHVDILQTFFESFDNRYVLRREWLAQNREV